MKTKPHTVQDAINHLHNITALSEQIDALKQDPKYPAVVQNPIIAKALKEAGQEAANEENKIRQLKIEQ